jgi:hypothetical protein
LRAGTSDTLATRYTNASKNRYQPVRPFLFIDPMLSGLDAGKLKLEWQHPRTKAWAVVPLVETGNGPIAEFTEGHAARVSQSYAEGCVLTGRVVPP